MIQALERKDFEEKASEAVADFLRLPCAHGVGLRLPLVILIEACAAAIAEISPAGESVETLSDKIGPSISRGFQRGFDTVNARLGREVAPPRTPFVEVIG